MNFGNNLRNSDFFRNKLHEGIVPVNFLLNNAATFFHNAERQKIDWFPVLIKLNLVARFIETFAVYRGANYRNFSQSSIRYTMYNLVLVLRDKSINEVGEILKRKLTDVEENLAGISRLGMHGQNKHFIKFLLSRITAHIEQQSGRTTDFST